MAAGEIRWRRLRRRGAFRQPETDLPQWELQILDSLHSVAQVSAERWVMAGPYSGSSSSAIVSAMGSMQPGWLVKIAPVALPSRISNVQAVLTAGVTMKPFSRVRPT